MPAPPSSPEVCSTSVKPVLSLLLPQDRIHLYIYICIYIYYVYIYVHVCCFVLLLLFCNWFVCFYSCAEDHAYEVKTYGGLSCAQSGGDTKRWYLTQHSCLFGSAAHCAIRFMSKKVAGMVAEITVDDLGRAWGSVVDGASWTTPVMLQDNDVLDISEVHFTYHGKMHATMTKELHTDAAIVLINIAPCHSMHGRLGLE